MNRRFPVRGAWLLAAGAAILAAGCTAYLFLPRQATLRDFDPARVARLEASMWRDYYERDYAGLFRGLYMLNRKEYRFSPWDSIRLAYFAGIAARRFQPTEDRREAQVAAPALTRYYTLIRARAGERFDPQEAASLELDWWQMRREGYTPRQYGNRVADVSAEVYGFRSPMLEESARIRAEMMHYRDQRRDGRMQAADWAHIESELAASYAMLREEVRSIRPESGK